MRFYAFALASLTALAAHAQTLNARDAAAAGRTPEKCAASFRARLAETRAAIKAQAQYMKEYNRAMPWFNEHCRVLSPLEIAIRKLDDPNSFVCDTSKGRPAGLTTRFVIEHASPMTISGFQEHSADSMFCAALGDPVSLYLEPSPEPDEEQRRSHQLWQSRELLRVSAVGCFEATGARATACAAATKDIQDLIAKLEPLAAAEASAQ